MKGRTSDLLFGKETLVGLLAGARFRNIEGLYNLLLWHLRVLVGVPVLIGCHFQRPPERFRAHY